MMFGALSTIGPRVASARATGRNHPAQLALRRRPEQQDHQQSEEEHAAARGNGGWTGRARVDRPQHEARQAKTNRHVPAEDLSSPGSIPGCWILSCRELREPGS